MKTLFKILAIVIVCAAANAEPPYISYIYPAGGQTGTECNIMIGGRNLRIPEAVYITNKTAACEIIEFIPPIRPIKDDDRIKFRERIAPLYKNFKLNGQQPLSDEEALALKEQLPDYPKESVLNHPLLRNLESMNPTELEDIVQKFVGRNRPDAQFAEQVSVKISIKENAKPGIYEIRLLSASGLSNPMNFQIDRSPEYKEREPNNEECYFDPPNTPLVFNGQIMPGDIDMFQFNASKGEKLVIEANARNLKPYMADAVPGWFQAVMTLSDTQGNELAFCDDYLFNPDPVMFFEVPQTGTYVVKVYDSIYRGREDFVYRISVSQKPFVESVFPLGTGSGKNTIAQATGWNLPKDTIELDGSSAGRGSTRIAEIKNNGLHSNKILYAVDQLPDCLETAGNDSLKTAQAVKLPIIINGRIETPGDNDFVSFEGAKGDKVVIEVNARRLGSPLDSAVELYDDGGKVVTMNDDHSDKAVGLQTHHADSYLTAELPKNGKYCIRVFDVRNEGSPQFGYRLRISAPMPTYELRLTPSGLSLNAGQTGTLRVDVIRKDGFDDDIMLGLKSMPPADYKLSGGKIPAGKDSIMITVTAPAKLQQPSELTIESRAKTEQGIVSRPAVAAENIMQAFAYYQLVPSQDLLAVQQSTKRVMMPAFEAKYSEITFAPGQSVKLTFINRNKGNLTNWNIDGKLLTETDKLILKDFETTQDSIILTIQATDDCPVGYKDNIVVGLSLQTEFKRKDGTMQKQTVSLNELPAVAVEIVEKRSKV